MIKSKNTKKMPRPSHSAYAPYATTQVNTKPGVSKKKSKKA